MTVGLGIRLGLLELAVTERVWDSFGRAGADAGEVDRLQWRILVEVQVGERIERRSLVDRVDGDGEGARDNVIAGAPVVDVDGDGSRTRGVSDRGKGDRAGGVGAGVGDGGIGDQAGVAGAGRHGEGLGLVGRARS